MKELVVLVNEKDEAIGTMEKMEAHQKGLLHRAFSIFIFNSKQELLLQKRASGKYHSGGLWTNTCCSHPRPHEPLILAAERRLKEEMGLQCDLNKAFSFVYKVSFDGGLTEYELDHVLTGITDDEPVLNVSEASEWRYISISDLEKELENNPEDFTFWFRLCVMKAIESLK